MIQVKAFDEQHEDDLTASVNKFLSTLSDESIVSIQFSTANMVIEEEQIYCFSALVVYRIKK